MARVLSKNRTFERINSTSPVIKACSSPICVGSTLYYAWRQRKLFTLYHSIFCWIQILESFANSIQQVFCALPYHRPHLLVDHRTGLARQPQDLLKPVDMQQCLHAHQREATRPRHTRHSHMREVGLLERCEVQHGRGGMQAARDSADVVREWHAGIDQCHSRRVDRGLEHTAILLQHMYKDIDLRTRIQARLHHRLERRLDRRRQLQYAPSVLIQSNLSFFHEGNWTKEMTNLSPRPRRRRSFALNGAMVTSTCMEARSCSVGARTRASRGPNTLTRTSVSPCATRAEPSVPAWGVESKDKSRSSYCRRPSERNPPSLRISMRELCGGWGLSKSRWGGRPWYLPYGTLSPCGTWFPCH